MNYTELLDLELPVAAAVIKLGDGWCVEQANSLFGELLGYEAEEIEQKSGDDLIDRKDRYLMEETLEQVVHLHDIAAQEVRIIRKDKTVRWVDIRCNLLGYVDAIPRLLLFMWDIHENKTKQLEQDMLNKRYEAMETLSQEYPFDVDVVNERIIKNSRFLLKIGEKAMEDSYCSLEEMRAYLFPQDQENFYRVIQEASRIEKTGNFDVRFNISSKPEETNYIWFRIFYKSIADEEGKIVRIIGRSYNVNGDKALQEAGKKDPLTKLYNKTETLQMIAHFLEENDDGTHAMLLIDIDNFKGINDNFGHLFGDSVIVEVAESIKGLFRGNDIIGRVGGDEFLVFMKNTTLEKTRERSKRLCEVLQKKYSGKQLEYAISGSIGISLYPVDGRDCHALFVKADHAMYRAKQAGKNCYEIANANDIGQIQSETKSVDKHIVMPQEDQEFLGYAVSIMSHAKNQEASMNMLLKRIAERFDLRFVGIFEDDSERRIATMTNHYHETVVLPDNIEIPMSDDTVNGLADGEYLVIKNSLITELNSQEKNVIFLESKGFKEDGSCLICRFRFAQSRMGAMFYNSRDPEREWTAEEIHVLQELTRTISIFVTLRFRLNESQEKIRNLQRKDMLTGLLNQDAFRQVVPRKLMDKKPDEVWAIEYFDINNFGYVNENYGYKVGDNILKLLAEDLMKQPYYVTGCRLYSDFFLVLLKERTREHLEECMKNRSRRFSNMQNHKYPNSSMGVTAGVYLIEEDYPDIDKAIENATLAWKQAKKGKKGNIEFFDESMRASRSEEQQVIGEFYEALYRDDFQMYLQPKFVLGSGKIYGAEALARWHRPDGKVLSPAIFIDSLEKIGYITELDFYIFEEVLKTLDNWRRKNIPPMVISTNFSGHHFEGDGKEFLSRITHILSKYQVSPKYVEIEVTESVFVENIEGLFACLKELRQMGFRVAIDDFGTGYSSLAMLADVPADVVKIDKSFINKNMSEKKKRLLYEIGNMVRILEKEIIVEGVETKEQETYLMEGGFTCGQGYLCNKPIPRVEFEKLYV